LRAADTLRDEGYMVTGNAPIYAILREARDRAKMAGAKDIEERSIQDAPVGALDLAGEVNADLLGNAGLSGVLGRLFSVRGSVSSKAKADVLMVHTTG
jgi:nucleotide-binding universal stress UspA family protein